MELEVPETIQKITRLEITTISHDQGFSSDQAQCRNTYVNCFSYFEVFVITPTGHDRVRPRFLQTNRHAMLGPFRHHIVWKVSSADPELQSWLNAIQGGDAVHLVPHARFLAGQNHVYEAEIEASGLESEDNPARPDAIQRSFGQQQSLYQALDSTKQEIRLLRLLFGDSGEDLRCETFQSSLRADGMTTYECISYCWHSVLAVEKIGVVSPHSASTDLPSLRTEQKSLPIPGNLYAALRNLRFRDRWADAICINQSDLQERADQVTMMKRTFASASNVVVWLGEESDPQVIANLQKIKKLAERFASESSLDEERIRALHNELLGDEYNTTWCPLFENEWFRRAWVVQEVIISDSVTVQLGQYTLS